MKDEISHLTAGAAALLVETDDRRIRAIRSRRWVLYHAPSRLSIV